VGLDPPKGDVLKAGKLGIDNFWQCRCFNSDSRNNNANSSVALARLMKGPRLAILVVESRVLPLSTRSVVDQVKVERKPTVEDT